MFNIYLTSDPVTGRAFYKDESKFVGCFASLAQAAQELGDAFLSFCSINTVK